MNESVYSQFCTCFGDTFGYFNVDELKIFSAFDFMTRAEEVNGNVGIGEHALHLRLVAVVHAVV
jgi:hypothetical protein